MTGEAMASPSVRVPAGGGRGRAGVFPASLFLLFLILSLGVLAGASGAPPPAPVAFQVLHTANGLGELSPCG